jgi:hypothetical protein
MAMSLLSRATTFKLFASGVAVMTLPAASADAAIVAIAGYDITDGQAPGTGGFTSTYNGTVTTVSGYVVDYSGGTSGTLNDGFVSASEQDTQFLCLGAGSACNVEPGDPRVVSPTLTLHFAQATKFSSFDFLSDYLNNYGVGNIDSVLVTIGSQSETVFASNYGPANPAGYGLNQTVTLSSLLADIATTSVTFSGFTVKEPFANAVSFSEVVANTGAVPEPASWAMMLAGFGLMGFAMRRRSVRPVAAR